MSVVFLLRKFFIVSCFIISNCLSRSVDSCVFYLFFWFSDLFFPFCCAIVFFFASPIESNNLLRNWFIMPNWYRLTSSILKIIEKKMNPQLNILWIGFFFRVRFCFSLGFCWMKIFFRRKILDLNHATTAIVLNTIFDIKSSFWTYIENEDRKKRKQATTIFEWNIKGAHLILCRFIFTYRAKHTTDCAMCVCWLYMYVRFIRSAIYFPCLLCDVYFCVFNTSLFCHIQKKQKIIRPLCDAHNLWIKTYGFFFLVAD